MANQVVGLGMKLRFLFIFTVTLLIGLALAEFFATRSRMSSRVIDQWETTNGNIDIRVKAFAEDGWGPRLRPDLKKHGKEDRARADVG